MSREPDLVQPSPLRRRHGEIRRQGITRHIPRQTDYRQLLYGPPGREVRFPLMALRAEKALGACRHALAQRVVAGTLEITHGFGPAGPPSASAAAPPEPSRVQSDELIHPT